MAGARLDVAGQVAVVAKTTASKRSTTTPAITAQNARAIDVAAPPAGLVTIANQAGTSVTLALSEPASVTAPVGGWNRLDRVTGPAASDYTVRPPAGLSLSTFLHRDLLAGGDVPAVLRRLTAMGQPPAGQDVPLPVQVVGDVETDPATLWCITGLTVEGAVYVPGTSTVLAIRVPVTLEEYVRQDVVTAVTVASTRTKAGTRRRRTIRARKGDSLRTIAVRELGRSSDWKKLRDWNPRLGRLDPDAVLKVGARLQVR